MADREQQEKNTPDNPIKQQDVIPTSELDDPLEKILGIFDDDITDLSTSVRDNMDELRRQQAKDTD